MEKPANKAVFLDRDGTINRDVGYLCEIERFEFLPGVVRGLRALQEMGFLLVIITNQSGIARGRYTEAEYAALTDHMLAELRAAGVRVADVMFCPHHPDAPIQKYRKKCGCRKPGTALFHEAKERWDIDFAQSFAIGDRLRDCSICFETECRGIVVGTAGTGGLNVGLLRKNGVEIAESFDKAVESIKDAVHGRKRPR